MVLDQDRFSLLALLESVDSACERFCWTNEESDLAFESSEISELTLLFEVMSLCRFERSDIINSPNTLLPLKYFLVVFYIWERVKPAPQNSSMIAINKRVLNAPHEFALHSIMLSIILTFDLFQSSKSAGFSVALSARSLASLAVEGLKQIKFSQQYQFY